MSQSLVAFDPRVAKRRVFIAPEGEYGLVHLLGIKHSKSHNMSYPEEHWRRIRTNNPLERIMREIRHRTRVVGSFPDGQSALMLVAARLRHIAGTKWGTRRYLNMIRLYELEQLKENAA